MAFEDKNMRYFYRISGKGEPVAGSLIKRRSKPKNGRWLEVARNICCLPTTTTTTSSSTTTTTT